MPRRRVVDSKIWTDDKFIELNSDEKLLFIGMMNFSDDKGIHKNNPKVLKIEIFPADPDIDFKYVEDMIKKLLHKELLLMSEDKKLLRYVNWETYQKIQHKTPSKYEDDNGDITIPFLYHYNNGTIKELYNDNNDTIPLCHNIIEDNIIEDKVKENNTKEDSNKIHEKQKHEFSFEYVYSIYPRKRNKEASEKSFNRIAKKTFNAFYEGLLKHIEYWKDEDVDIQFIPHLSTFINGKRWEDEIPTTKKKEFASDLDKEIHNRHVNQAVENKRLQAYLDDANENAVDESPDLLADFKKNKESNAQPIKDIVGQVVSMSKPVTSPDGK